MGGGGGIDYNQFAICNIICSQIAASLFLNRKDRASDKLCSARAEASLHFIFHCVFSLSRAKSLAPGCQVRKNGRLKPSAYGINFVGGLNVIFPNETCWSQMQENDSFVMSP